MPKRKLGGGGVSGAGNTISSAVPQLGSGWAIPSLGTGRAKASLICSETQTTSDHNGSHQLDRSNSHSLPKIPLKDTSARNGSLKTQRLVQRCLGISERKKKDPYGDSTGPVRATFFACANEGGVLESQVLVQFRATPLSLVVHVQAVRACVEAPRRGPAAQKMWGKKSNTEIHVGPPNSRHTKILLVLGRE